ncbi:hypothetical protein [Chelativorans sp.]|uniref:hypothetical protein n=1 Tax=Chelativorans sp. TaxID=2203393 RepID=UPI002810AAA7|nr:hypothetical protein [Chelativorans sp.]
MHHIHEQPLAMPVRFSVECLHASPVLQQRQRRARDRVTPGEAAGLIKLLGGRSSAYANDLLQHDAGAEGIAPKRLATARDECVAFAPKSEAAVERGESRNGGRMPHDVDLIPASIAGRTYG